MFWQGFGAFFTPIVDTFGWSRGATALALSFNRIESGGMSIAVGYLLDKYGPRKLMAFGLFVTGLGFIGMSQMQNLWHFYVVMAVLTFGMSFGTFIPIVATVGNWFVRKRSRAIGLLMSASAIGGMTAPLLVWFVDTLGWRDALLSVGIGFWIIGIPAIIVMTRQPEDVGLLPDGDPVPKRKPGDMSLPVNTERRTPIFTALRTRFFWQLSIGTSLGHLVSSTTLLHIDAMQSFDISRTTAGIAVFGFGLGSFVGRLVSGLIGDYVDKRYIMAAAFYMQIIGVLGLVSLNATIGGVFLGQWGLVFYSAFFGAGFGSSIPVRMAMIGDYFGRQTYGSMLGIMSTVNAVLGAFGPVFVGVMFDVTDTYRTPFLILIVVLVASGPMMLTLEKPSRVKARFRIAAHEADLRAAAEAEAAGKPLD
ncbi:MAG: MFS transporter [Chloroflexi bacterium]|nr:MFS transporter [Chloroflexota bacterium]MBT4074528.1 MFS transporter [Chloroflexota bacterium]MBT5318401.1 MFS transporter [Chloroflexota bacterium]MBT6681598.1 MFS transporter [Chloroflexota bacterium]